MKTTEKIGLVLFFWGLIMLLNLNIQSLRSDIAFEWALVEYGIAILGAFMFILGDKGNNEQGEKIGKEKNSKKKGS